MKLLTKYIAKNILLSILMISIILIGIEIFIEFTREFSDIGTGFYGWFQAALYVPMMLPQDIYQLFPMAGLLGSLIGLGLLANHSELIVMRASGVSVAAIARVVLKVALVLTVAMVLVGEVLAPISQHKAIARKAQAMGGGQALVTRTGVWVRSANNFIHIGTISANGKELNSVVRYEFNGNQRLVLASFAQKGDFVNGKWVFSNVKQSHFINGHIESFNFTKQTWPVKFDPKLLGIASFDTEQKSLPELYRYIHDRESNGLDAEHFRLVFWQRIFQPISILVMLLLSVPFMFGNLRKVTMGLRILVGILVGFGFFALNQFIGPLSIVYDISPLLAASIPSCVFAVLACFLLARAR